MNVSGNRGFISGGKELWEEAKHGGVKPEKRKIDVKELAESSGTKPTEPTAAGQAGPATSTALLPADSFARTKESGFAARPTRAPSTGPEHVRDVHPRQRHGRNSSEGSGHFRGGHLREGHQEDRGRPAICRLFGSQSVQRT